MHRQQQQRTRETHRLRHGLFSGLVGLLACVVAACGASSAHTAIRSTPVPTATPLPKGWNAVASPRVGMEGNLLAVGARSQGDVWAVGQYQGIDGLQHTLTEHWDGTRWLVVASSNPGTVSNTLVAVSVIAAADAWAVGEVRDSTGTRPLIEHWDGSVWSVVASAPLPTGLATSTLMGVAGTSATDVWAVGSTDHGPGASALIEHWDGMSWQMANNTPQFAQDDSAKLIAITAISPTNAWAVGKLFQQGIVGYQELIEHWDGSHWSQIQGAGGDASTPHILSGISAVSATDIWAVGDGAPDSNYEGGCGEQENAIIEHWDGAHWANVPAAAIPANQYPSLASVAAVSANDVWAVGATAPNLTRHWGSLLEHWNGSAWSVVPSPTPLSVQGLVGAAAAAGSVWVVGQQLASSGPGATLVEQWSNGQWDTVPSPSPGTLANSLAGVAVASASDVWAVGGSAEGTLAEHWDGATWNVIPTPNGSTEIGPNTSLNNSLQGVAVVSASDVWAVGGSAEGALAEHWDGTKWSLVSPHSGGLLAGVAAVSASNVWAVGVGSGIEHWDGTKWSTVPAASRPEGPAPLYGVAAVSANDVWAVGGNAPQGCGTLQPAIIEHWNGTSWSSIPGLPQGVLYSVAAVSATDVWAVGSDFSTSSFIMHWDGAYWASVKGTKGGAPRLYGVAARAKDDVWAVGTHPSDDSSSPTSQPLIEHWNGAQWTSASTTGSGTSTNILSGVALVPNGQVWAVGRFSATFKSSIKSFIESNTSQALIMRYVP